MEEEQRTDIIQPLTVVRGKHHQDNQPGTQVPTFVVDDTNVTLQDDITINKRERSSHNKITISENTTQMITPKEIRITTQTPTTITIRTQHPRAPQRDDANQALHKAGTCWDPNNNVQANLMAIIQNQRHKSTTLVLTFYSTRLARQKFYPEKKFSSESSRVKFKNSIHSTRSSFHCFVSSEFRVLVEYF